jgi:hypothetical protein
MPTIHDLAKGRFLKKEDVGRGLLLTIKGWHEENVAMENQPPELKYCLDFVESEKPLVLNIVNGQLIAQFLGSDDLDDWTGKKIVLFTDPTVMMGQKMVGGIRARAPKPDYLPTTPKPQPPRPRPPSPPPVPEPENEPSGETDDVPF